jgi:CBS domain-containing protein
MLCEEVASRAVEPLTRGQTARDAALRLRDERVSWLPVCDETNTVIGIVTGRDLLLHVCCEDRQASSVPVDALMVTDFPTCNASEPLAAAEDLMIRTKTGRVVVVDQEGHLFGVISLTDVLHYSDPLRAASVARFIKDQEFRVRSHHSLAPKTPSGASA